MGVEPDEEDEAGESIDGSADAAAAASADAADEARAVASADAEADSPADADALAERLDAEDVVFVDALNGEIADVLERAPSLRFDYVVGDVSGAGMSSNGHLHFDLVHDDASVHCVVYGFRLDRIDPEIEEGLQVAVRGDLSYYEADGQVSVLVDDVVALGEGVYERTYRENRRILADDGLLDDEAKQPLPAFPQTIGIATSAESDAREDAVTSVHGRHPGVDVVIEDTSVQGEDAMASMMRAISRLDEDARVDVIVLTRGGGSDKHLRVFNETPLCRVIADTDTPIVVGVGHETDRTLADEVADRRVMTPTHVGEIVPERDALDEEVDELAERLDGAYARTVAQRLADVERDLATAYERRVADELSGLRDDLDHAFETAATERLTALENRLDHALERREQASEHEREKAEVAERYERSRRRQRLVIAALVVLVLLLLAYVLL